MKIVLLAAAALVIFSSCKDDVNSPGNTDNNLISNPSFENMGNPSLEGWQTQGTINFFQDVPPEGGSYSIGINSEWGPSDYAAYTIPAQKNKKIYNFSCWAKTKTLPAEISISLVRDSILSTKSIVVADTVWTKYTIVDSLNISEGDSIRIFLKGSISQLLQAVTYYDNCRLECE